MLPLTISTPVEYDIVIDVLDVYTVKFVPNTCGYIVLSV